MEVTVENDYVTSYALIGSIEGGIEVDAPEDLEYFQDHFESYKLVNNTLVYDASAETHFEYVRLQQEIRELRQQECFSVIDRSKLWYDTLTDSQLQELRIWYDLWLKATDTLIIPEKPTWL